MTTTAPVTVVETLRAARALIHGSTPATERPLPPDVEHAYQEYLASHWGDLSNMAELAETMFNAGGRHAVQAMIVFGDIVPQLHRIEGKVKVLLELLESFA